MYAAEGIVTARGGRTSHAAVVAVGMGKPCVVGAGEVRRRRGAADLRGGRPRRCARATSISIDGATGEVILDAVRLVGARAAGRVQGVAGAGPTATGRIGVRANADTPEDARQAREFGAEGIGLVRTEHMFFARRPHLDRARDDHGRRHRRAAGGGQKLLPFQRDDFIGIFRAMDGLPVTIRLLDPPLHEFLANPKEYREMLEERARLDALGMNPARKDALDETAGQDRRAARGQSDARPPRLPARDHLAGDLRHAGAGHHGGGLHGGRAGA